MANERFVIHIVINERTKDITCTFLPQQISKLWSHAARHFGLILTMKNIK